MKLDQVKLTGNLDLIKTEFEIRRREKTYLNMEWIYQNT